MNMIKIVEENFKEFVNSVVSSIIQKEFVCKPSDEFITNLTNNIAKLNYSSIVNQIKQQSQNYIKQTHYLKSKSYY